MPENLLQVSYGIQQSILDQITAIASSVKSGVIFLDKNGELQTGTLSLSGNAAVGNVLSGKTFYSNSWTKQTGTMTNRGAVSKSINPGSSYTIPAGYHNGSGKVIANAARTSQILCAYVYDTNAEKYRVLGTDKFYFSGLTCQKACNVRIRGEYTLWAWAGIEIQVNGSNIYNDSTNDPKKSSSYNITRYMNAGDTIGIRVTKLGYGIYCDIVVETV